MKLSIGGHSLLEMLVALSLLSITLSPLLRGFHSLAQTMLNAHDGSRQQLVQAKLRRLILTSSKQAQSRLGFRSFQIHLKAREHIAFQHSSNALQAKSDSAALSFLHFAPRGRLRVVERKILGSSRAHIRACAIGEFLMPEHFLAVSVDGYQLVEAHLQQTQGATPDCLGAHVYEGNLTALPANPFTGGLLRVETGELLQRVVMLLPLEDAFSIYLAKNNSLRFYSHLRYQNQPLAYDLDSFSVSKLDDSSTLAWLEFTLLGRQKKRFQMLLAEESAQHHSYLNHVL